jgi:hypothetical protein
MHTTGRSGHTRLEADALGGGAAAVVEFDEFDED